MKRIETFDIILDLKKAFLESNKHAFIEVAGGERTYRLYSYFVLCYHPSLFAI